MTPFSAALPSTDRAKRGPILVVCPVSLDHGGHGNYQRTLQLVRHLGAAGFDVDVVYQATSPGEPSPEVLATFRRVHRVEGPGPLSQEKRHARRLAAFYGAFPRNVSLEPSASLTALARALLQAEPYDTVLGTYAWSAPVLSGLARPLLRICDVQDVFHQHADACEQLTGQRSPIALSATVEAFLWRQWDALLAITPEDAGRIERALLPHQRLLVVPHAVARMADAADAGPDDVAFYSASDNDPNVQAMSWFLREVWPRVRQTRPAAQVRIAGLICGALPEDLRNQPGVELLGFRPDLRADMADSGVIVAPYLYGSGLKIKVVEAACAGKAIVMTPAGLPGTGLEPGQAIDVHERPDAFAHALVTLLGSRPRREKLARHALEQARQRFSADACYGPVVRLIRVSRSLEPGLLGAGRLRWIKSVFEYLAPGRVVIWGNGAHTRELIAGLSPLGVSPALIVDGQGRTSGSSPEGFPVVAASAFRAEPDDLIILSSGTFEREMWRDVAPLRAAGALVMALYQSRPFSEALDERLTGRVARRPPPRTSRRSFVFWDTQATATHWTRLAWLRDLACAAGRHAWRPVITTSTSLASASVVSRDLAAVADMKAILDIDARDAEANAPSDLRTMARMIDLASRSAAQALQVLDAGADDVLVLASPSLTECAGLVRALAAVAPGQRPAVVLYRWAPQPGERDRLGLSDADLLAYYRLTSIELAEATGGRLGLVTSGRSEPGNNPRWTDLPVRSIDYPASLGPRADNGLPSCRGGHVACFADLRSPETVPLLQALIGAPDHTQPGDARPIEWRSANGRPHGEADERIAYGIAAHLGVTLLDEAGPVHVQERIATAAKVFVVAAPSADDDWSDAIYAHAAAAGVPVAAPDAGLAPRPIEGVRAAVAADRVFEQLLQAVYSE